MKKPKYRIKEYDPVHDIWILERKGLWFWKRLSVGSKEKLEQWVENEGKFEKSKI